jgi:hypothetical protein
MSKKINFDSIIEKFISQKIGQYKDLDNYDDLHDSFNESIEKILFQNLENWMREVSSFSIPSPKEATGPSNGRGKEGEKERPPLTGKGMKERTELYKETKAKKDKEKAKKELVEKNISRLINELILGLCFRNADMEHIIDNISDENWPSKYSIILYLCNQMNLYKDSNIERILSAAGLEGISELEELEQRDIDREEISVDNNIVSIKRLE